VPTDANGTQIGNTVSITPTSLSNYLEFTWSGWGQPTITDSSLSIALFETGSANAIAIQTGTSGQNICQMTFFYRMQVTSLATQTFKIHGAPTTGNIQLNGNSVGTRRYGGVSASSFIVREVAIGVGGGGSALEVLGAKQAAITPSVSWNIPANKLTVSGDTLRFVGSAQGAAAAGTVSFTLGGAPLHPPIPVGNSLQVWIDVQIAYTFAGQGQASVKMWELRSGVITPLNMFIGGVVVDWTMAQTITITADRFYNGILEFIPFTP
jgi:hypothetical protein